MLSVDPYLDKYYIIYNINCFTSDKMIFWVNILQATLPVLKKKVCVFIMKYELLFPQVCTSRKGEHTIQKCVLFTPKDGKTKITIHYVIDSKLVHKLLFDWSSLNYDLC
jgi:hypothetical protein